jgi:hypothetical protein
LGALLPALLAAAGAVSALPLARLRRGPPQPMPAAATSAPTITALRTARLTA